MSTRKPTFVTQPSLPELEELYPYLQKIWASKTLTNGGPFHQELEEMLREHLGIKHISLFNNGTIALIVALQALGISGEVITTPYSFVATSHTLLWNNIKPIFVDIQPDTFNLDPSKIEAAITSKTSAIMPVHCYGTTCNTIEIERIAKKHNLKVIYDAAHAFGVNQQSNSILNFGDLSVLSFHATKVFNTFEGGAIVSHSVEMKNHIDQLKNFGFISEVEVLQAGINGKMSELNAAIGLLQLKNISALIKARQTIAERYNQQLSNIPGIEIPAVNSCKESNFSYYPILVTNRYPISRDALYEKLKDRNIFSRRYFYPLITNFPMYRNHPSSSPSLLPVANRVANEILCLPIFPNLDSNIQDEIIAFIRSPEFTT
jgi:dTDP-4-amino-4,6-dideoxygalactose transaminase